jgi:hypothetical protein
LPRDRVRVIEVRTTQDGGYDMSVQLLDALDGGQISPFESNAADPQRPIAFEPPLALGGDDITRLIPPNQNPPFGPSWGNNAYGSPFGSSLFGQIGALLQQIGQLLSQFMSGNGEHYFQNANGASTGDPHLSFNGSTWDNMQSQPNLLSSDSFPGGYRISTQATPPNANGVTYNESATITSNYGTTSVTLDKSGNATILQNGTAIPIQAGQTIDLCNGESATRNQNGSLQVTNVNGFGGTITTTLSLNGNGVDVNVGASNVDLGGTLVSGPNGWSSGTPGTVTCPPPMRRY